MCTTDDSRLCRGVRAERKSWCLWVAVGGERGEGSAGVERAVLWMMQRLVAMPVAVVVLAVVVAVAATTTIVVAAVVVTVTAMHVTLPARRRRLSNNNHLSWCGQSSNQVSVSMPYSTKSR